MNMDEDIWIGSVCSSVTIAKQGLILVISKGSDKNMLVPNMSPDWQFIALRGPDVKSHMLIFSTEQASGLHCKMHRRHMLIFSTEQSSGLCCRMHHHRRHCWAVGDRQPWKTRARSGERSICYSSWQRGSGGFWGRSRLCCRLPASYDNHQGRGDAMFYLNCTSYLLRLGIIFSLYSTWHSVVLPHYWRSSNGVTKSEFRSALCEKCI